MANQAESLPYWAEEALRVLFKTIASIVFLFIIILVFVPLGPILTVIETFSKKKFPSERTYFQKRQIHSHPKDSQ
jgi:hypothetical protein